MPVINNSTDLKKRIKALEKELDVEFELEIDSFGISGLLRFGVINILILILLVLIYRDCKKI